jgi:hypothetical protein
MDFYRQPSHRHMSSSFALTVLLWTGAQVRFAMLDDADYDACLKELAVWAPGADVSSAEFYVKERLLRRGLPFTSQGVLDGETILAVPSNSSGTDFPAMIVVSIRAGLWNLKPASPLPIYLRVHFTGEVTQDLLLEAWSDEDIETLRKNILLKSGRQSSQATLQANGKPLNGLTVGSCGLVSGSRIEAAISATARPVVEVAVQRNGWVGSASGGNGWGGSTGWG